MTTGRINQVANMTCSHIKHTLRHKRRSCSVRTNPTLRIHSIANWNSFSKESVYRTFSQSVVPFDTLVESNQAQHYSPKPPMPHYMIQRSYSNTYAFLRPTNSSTVAYVLLQMEHTSIQCEQSFMPHISSRGN